MTSAFCFHKCVNGAAAVLVNTVIDFLCSEYSPV